jgi:SAM-dependent methyltransferase
MTRLEGDYYHFMGFDSAHSREVLDFYLPLFESASSVLELGPGRGEFLSLLGKAGISAEGVDMDERMVEVATEQGLKVVLGDAIQHVQSVLPPASYSGVFAAHLLEHLEPGQVQTLLAGVHRVLQPGGRFVAVVPNPACYAVLTHDYWRDPTHVRFYDVPLLEFLCSRAGLTVQQSGGNPRNTPGPPPELCAQGPQVDPSIDQLIDEITADIGAQRRNRLLPRRSGPAWTYRIAHLIKVLDERLQATQTALRSLHNAYANLLQTMYQSNEIYVVADK